MKQLPIGLKGYIVKNLIEGHILYYPTAFVLSNWWSFGLLTGVCLVFQIFTGVWLALYYSSDSDYSFITLQHIMREVHYGWLIRYLHMNGASMCFILVYLHMAKSIYLRSFLSKFRTWRSGVGLLLLFMASAFMGYNLPWSQMGYWGAVVITSLLTSIPYIGQDITSWLWGHYGVANFTLKRFFALHFILPFVLLSCVTIHLTFLHEKSSSAPLQTMETTYLNFGSSFYLKDIFGLYAFLFLFYYSIFINPYGLNHVDSFVMANFMTTPHHIVPEWYFLPYYAMLRSFPNKLYGFSILVLSIVVLSVIPAYRYILFTKPVTIEIINNKKADEDDMTIYDNVFNNNYLFEGAHVLRNISTGYSVVHLICFWFFTVTCFVLGWIGTQPVISPFIVIGMGASGLYFFILTWWVDLYFIIGAILFPVLCTVYLPFPDYNKFEDDEKVVKARHLFSTSFKDRFLGFVFLTAGLPDFGVLKTILTFLILFVAVLLAVAFLTLAERKILAKLQRREGPAVTGLWGFFQPLVDGVKLFLKELIYPARSNYWLFWGAPIFALSLSLANWALIASSWRSPICDANMGLLLFFAIAALNTYTIILSAWASNSKFSLLGCLRAVAQLLSYELLLGLTVILVGFLSTSFNITAIVHAQQKGFFIFPLLPLAILAFILLLAETNRIPFDLPEAESELVSGYHTEYSAVLFAFFLVAEYSNILLMSCIWVIMFWGGWLPPFEFMTAWGVLPEVFFFSKVLIIVFCIIFVRALLPRYRYDQLLLLSWKYLLPFMMGFTFFFFAFYIYFDIIPQNLYLTEPIVEPYSTMTPAEIESFNERWAETMKKGLLQTKQHTIVFEQGMEQYKEICKGLDQLSEDIIRKIKAGLFKRRPWYEIEIRENFPLYIFE